MRQALSYSARTIVQAALALACIAAATDAKAQDFYAGKPLNLYIGQGPGGGYDLYGRLVARHIGRFIPGNPVVVPQNMPGAGGLKVANYLYHAAPQDGTALAISAEAVALEQALGGPGIEYDATRLGWVGRVTASASIFFTWHAARVKNIEDARKYESVFGSTGITGITGYTPRALNSLAGTKFKVVTGYNGSTDVLLAMERTEVDGGFALWPEFKQQKADWLRDKKVNILYIVAANRAADLPNVPTTGELGETSEARDILRFLGSTSEVGRAFFTTPNVPPARVAQLRQAFQAMSQDKGFQQEAEKANLRVDPLSGEELQKLVAGVVGFPKPLVEKANQARN
jgi:tripartite-type tricarboxylate transporter receptor subunit TctC